MGIQGRGETSHPESDYKGKQEGKTPTGFENVCEVPPQHLGYSVYDCEPELTGGFPTAHKLQAKLLTVAFETPCHPASPLPGPHLAYSAPATWPRKSWTMPRVQTPGPLHGLSPPPERPSPAGSVSVTPPKTIPDQSVQGSTPPSVTLTASCPAPTERVSS